ncbi:restriction endonuclease subunit S, partial [Bacteroides acidifaciens]|uniref:restriction endonuclease subunit S n=1 Tax=Bacteroides acidifaciens TaxID=85831 RepID=UPI00259B2D93
KKPKTSSSESHYQNFTPPFPIPDSWQWVKLEDIITIRSGENIVVRNLKDSDIFPVYGGNGINGYYEKANVEVDTLIIGRVGFYCGSIHRTKSKAWITDNALIVTTFANHLNIDWLQMALMWANIRDTSNSTAQPVVSGKSIYPIVVPLPPLEEQVQIANKFKSFEVCISQLSQEIDDLIDYVNTTKSKILELAMQGKLVPQDPTDEPAADMLRRVNPKARIITDNPHYPKWLCSYMGDVCEFERGITFPSNTKRFDKVPGYIACLRTANVHDEVDLSSLWYISEEYLKGNDAKKLKVGDVLMSTANSKELVGRSVLIRDLSEHTTFGGFVTVLRTQILLPEFFTLFLKYKTLKGDFSKIATQTTNIANLNTRILSTVIIPVPPTEEQSRIIQRVNRLFSVLDEIEASLQS